MAWPGTHANTRQWRKLRQAILTRDGYRCTRLLDGKRCTAHATEVDHILPYTQGGTDQPNNLASLCHHHHAEKTKRESAAARWRYKSTRPTEPHPGLNRPQPDQ